MFSKLFKLLRFIRRKIVRIEKHEVFVAERLLTQKPMWLPEEKVSIIAGGNELGSALRDDLLWYSPTNKEFIDAHRRCEVDGLFIHANDKLVHYAFLIRHNKTTRLIGFDNETALIGNMYTASDYRGKGYQKRATAALLDWAISSGAQRVIAETSYTNTASQQGLKNGGMQSFGKVELLIVFNFLVIRYKRPSDKISWLGVVF